jgi:hypothetical protein
VGPFFIYQGFQESANSDIFDRLQTTGGHLKIIPWQPSWNLSDIMGYNYLIIIEDT